MCRLIHVRQRFQTYIKSLDHYFFDAIGNVTRLAIIGQVYREALVPLKTTYSGQPKGARTRILYHSG